MSDAPSIADVLDRLEAISARLNSGPQRFLTVDAAATYAGISTKSVRRLIARGDLTPLRPVRGRVVVDRLAIDALVLSSTGRPRYGRGHSR